MCFAPACHALNSSMYATYICFWCVCEMQCTMRLACTHSRLTALITYTMAFILECGDIFLFNKLALDSVDFSHTKRLFAHTIVIARLYNIVIMQIVLWNVWSKFAQIYFSFYFHYFRIKHTLIFCCTLFLPDKFVIFSVKQKKMASEWPYWKSALLTTATLSIIS